MHDCTVEIGDFEIDARTIEQVKEAFHRRHEELYARAERHNAVEAVNIESTLYGRVDKPKPPQFAKGGNVDGARNDSRRLIFSDDGKAAAALPMAGRSSAPATVWSTRPRSRK